MASLDRDHLTGLPPKILTKILAEVPLSSFLNLTQTSRSLRGFIKENAARICNLAILTRFQQEAELLKVTLQNNWFVATEARLLMSQQTYEQRRREEARRKMRLLLPDLNKDPNNKLGPFPFKLQLKLDQPGPTLLSFFEEKPIEFKEAKSKVHGELYQYQLWIFLERVNRVLVREDEVNQWEPKEVKGVEMVWYYGVQRYEGKIEVFE